MIEIMNLHSSYPVWVYDIKVDRSSVLGNPYHMYGEQARDLVCEQYSVYCHEMLCRGTSDKAIAFRKEFMRLVKIYHEHGKLRLFCWCAPKRCHAQTLASYIESYTAQHYKKGV